MKGIISSVELTKVQVHERIKKYSNKEAVKCVSTKEKYTIEGNGMHLALYDFGMKTGIIDSLKKRNCKLTIVPYNTTAEEIILGGYDAVFLSNGPGDPEDLPEVASQINQLIGKKPVLGICLGHQLIALAQGGKTEKLKFGHRGVNHPVKDLEKGKVIITSQNHGYYVSEVPEDMVVTYLNVNDGTIEGIKHKKHPVCSVQFHPEANPGPKDADYIFDDLLDVVKEFNRG